MCTADETDDSTIEQDRLAVEVERLRAGIRDMADQLAGGPCVFWACPGRDHPIVPMATCVLCATVIELRELLVAQSPAPEQAAIAADGSGGP